MKLYLVRHGQTDWNKEKRLQGQEDIPLNDFGRHLAKETGIGLRNVRFDLCFSSDLKRALETANLILDEGSSKVPIIMDKRLKEIAFGEWEGKSVARNQMEVPDEFLKFYDDPEHFAGAPGGESFAEVKERTDDFLKWLVGQEEYEDKNILLLANTNAAKNNLERRIKSSCDCYTVYDYLKNGYSWKKYDLVILDECSTVCNEDVLNLFEKCNAEAYLLIGDIYQIEAIKFGNWFNFARYFVDKKICL